MFCHLKKWISLIDVISWLLVSMFFIFYAFLSKGNVFYSFLSSIVIILIMTVVSISIEIIIEVLKHKQGIGSILGFITNGPEALVLIVGILTGDALFGVSTPLGSNIINPAMIIIAALITGSILKVFKKENIYGLVVLVFTISATLVFYFLAENKYFVWVFVVFGITFYLFFKRPKETENMEDVSLLPGQLLIPSVLLLIIAGYFLDPVVEYARVISNVPKNTIGFLVLATLSSWPELKSCLVLFKKKMTQAAIVNIFISNITNIWLAAIGILVYLLFQT